MIKVDGIDIVEFRGIRKLTLQCDGKNFAICGPNGTGKSGVVDALEFGLTGNVSRLSGEGRGDVSVKGHSPHVDHRNNPKKAFVRVRVSIPSLGKTATIERSPHNPSSAIITPDDPQVVAVIKQLEAHPEMVLSRRELIRYVLATPGKRAEEVQALLHLDRVDTVRQVLYKISHQAERLLPQLKTASSNAQTSLLRALGIVNLTREKVLEAANAQRAILGLPPLAELKETTSLKDGMETPMPATIQRIPKAQALADIDAVVTALAELSGTKRQTELTALVNALRPLLDDPLLAKSAKLDNLYRMAAELIEGETCPLCDTPWDPAALRRHVDGKVQQLDEFSAQRRALEARIAPVASSLRKAKQELLAVLAYARNATNPVSLDAVSAFAANCASRADKLGAFLPLSDTINSLDESAKVPETVLAEIEELRKLVAGLPEQTAQDAARMWLTLTDERLSVYRKAKRDEKIADERALLAKKIYEGYVETSDAVLKDIYENVEKQFGQFYRAVNQGDEDGFRAQLVPSMGKLGFDVDFYGRGYFPPGAYHSEGHQDGMGLCLYLALMRHLHGSRFTFAVLDDVLMSVDVAHRREVCRLLKKYFPDTQFVMTTHDPVWLRHMKTEALIGGRIQFKSWTVDEGPTHWDNKEDVWNEIETHLARNEVREASAQLRHYLEYMAAELCDALRAQVSYKGDGSYSLGDLLPPAMSQFGKQLRAAKNVAVGWKQPEVVTILEARGTAFSTLAQASRAEEWQINKAVHYNSWANMSKEEFRPVVAAFKSLLEGFTCVDCTQILRVVPSLGEAECVRCDCGKTNYNLVKKGAE